MATVTCVKCGNGFTRTCSCQGNICPGCKSRARSAGTAARFPNGKQRRSNGRVAAPARPTLKRGYRVTYRDGRSPEVYDTAEQAADARAAARRENPPVRSFLRTVRVPIEAAEAG